MFDRDRNQFIKTGVESWLGPVVEPDTKISVCICLGFQANLFKQVKIHFPQRLSDAVGKFRHPHWASGATKVASAHHINPKLDGLGLPRLCRGILDAHQILDALLQRGRDSLLEGYGQIHGTWSPNQLGQIVNEKVST